MTTFIMLASWTDQGIRSVKESPGRLDQSKKLLSGLGGEMKSMWLTMGAHDFVAVYEAPDDATAARFSLMLGQAGNVRTQTLKAFPEATYRELVVSLR